MSFRYALAIAAMIAASSAFAAKPPKPPKKPPSAAVCDECHGLDGVATRPDVPHLNGQLPEFLTESMARFRAGRRPSSAAQHNSSELDDQEIEALAKYYAFQKSAERPVQPTDPEKVTAAGALYKKRCAKCHLEDGRDTDHDAPYIAGQSLGYLQAETRSFLSGKRKFPFLMDEAYQGLTPEDLDKLSHYFASQKP